MSTVIPKKIIINDDMSQLISSHIVNLFKPTYNPFKDRAVVDGGTNLNQFALQTYPYSMTDNPVKTMYNKKNIVTNLFLVTENFLTFINKINDIWANDTQQRTLSKVNYIKQASGLYTVDPAKPADSTAFDSIQTIIEGPTANKATRFDEYEKFARNGLQYNGLNTPGVGSTSIQELFLRYLYSTDSEKRDVAFTLADAYYGVATSMITAAKVGFIPMLDFNSDQFVVSYAKDEITLEYANPIELAIKYDETVHNKTNQKLYLYFPYITSNALRPSTLTYNTANPTGLIEPIIGTDTNLNDSLISIFTGVNASYQTVNTVITAGDADAGNAFANASFVRRGAGIAGTNPVGIGALVTNENMPVLTNSVWSVGANKFVNQAGYTVINISETGGGGDITFDHTDKIDFIDSLKFVIKAPTVFS